MAAIKEVNFLLALEIFVVCLIVSLLGTLKRKASKLFSQYFVNSNSPEIVALQREINVLQNEVDKQSDMAKRVNLWTEKREKEHKFLKLCKGRIVKLKSIEDKFYICLTVLLEGSRIGFIALNRYTPIAILSPDVIWPLASVLSYPTGMIGALGAPVWGVACYITIATLLTIILR